MPRFEVNDRVVHVPDHADGSGHRDAEFGVVTGVGPPTQAHRSRQYWVDYRDGSNVSKCTYERHLQPAHDDDPEGNNP